MVVERIFHLQCQKKGAIELPTLGAATRENVKKQETVDGGHYFILSFISLKLLIRTLVCSTHLRRDQYHY